MDLTKTHGISMDSWYILRIMVQKWTYSIEIGSWFRHGLMVWTWTCGIGKDSWYGHSLMVLTTPMLSILTFQHIASCSFSNTSPNYRVQCIQPSMKFFSTNQVLQECWRMLAV